MRDFFKRQSGWLAIIVWCIGAHVVSAAEKVQTCNGIASGAAYGACTAIKCNTPTSASDITLTRDATLKKYWAKWSEIAASSDVVNCSATPAWVRKSTTGITLGTTTPNPPTPQPGPVPSVGNSDAAITWTAPLTGTVTGYQVYMSNKEGTVGSTTDVGNVTSYTPKNLPEGEWYFSVAGYDAARTVGPKSAPVIRVSKPAEATKALSCTTAGLTVTCSLK